MRQQVIISSGFLCEATGDLPLKGFQISPKDDACGVDFKLGRGDSRREAAKPIVLMTLILTIVFGIVTVIAAIVGVIAWIASSRSQKSIQRFRQKVREGFVALSKGETPIYQDGLPDLDEKKKLGLIRDGILAMRKYRYADAIAKFQKVLDLLSNDSERCALLNLIGASQIRSSAYKDAE